MSSAHEHANGRSLPAHGFCERIIALYDPGQAPRWWIALQWDARPLFAPELRLREVPLDQVREAVEQAVGEGCRPHVFLPQPSDWAQVYDALGRYQDFTQLWICGRDDDAMTELLHHPSAEVLAIQQTDGYLVVPNPEYGRALDQVLDARLDDFREDPDSPTRIVGPGRSRHENVSRLNPYRILEVEVDRIAGTITFKQFYIAADPQGPRQSCDLPVLIPEAEQLQFEQGICRIDRSQDAQVAAVCTCLGIPALLTLGQITAARPPDLCQALTRSRERVLRELDQKERKKEFLAWMAAWRATYFAGAPLRPTADRPLPCVTRALEEVVREFGLFDLLRPRPMPSPTLDALGRYRAGAMHDEKDLGEYLVDVAQAFARDDDE